MIVRAPLEDVNPPRCCGARMTVDPLFPDRVIWYCPRCTRVMPESDRRRLQEVRIAFAAAFVAGGIGALVGWLLR